MKSLQEIQKILDKFVTIPIDLPRLYFLGDTGAGKTTLIRKILGTDNFAFPSIRQTRTTVATTEFVIVNQSTFKGVFIFKQEEEVKGSIQEIISDSIVKCYTRYTFDVKKIAKRYLKQTSDQRFRLYYLLDNDEMQSIAHKITSLKPKLDEYIGTIKGEFPDENDETLILELALGEPEIKTELNSIVEWIFNRINFKIGSMFEGVELKDKYFNFETRDREQFIKKCKIILASERNTISPVIEYARIQGKLIANWLEDTELVLVDGEGIGHDTREAGQIDPRHYDQFYLADHVVLIEESRRPFVGGGKHALKNIYSRGYGDKLAIFFSKLDEVIPDDSKGSIKDKVDLVLESYENVCAALREDNISIHDNIDKVFFLHALNEDELDSFTKEQINNFLSFIKESKSPPSFVEPIFDYEMLSAYLFESAKEFIKNFFALLDEAHWQTVKAFNRRMTWGKDGFKHLLPIVFFEAYFNKSLDQFISEHIRWKQPISSTQAEEYLNLLKREINHNVISYSRNIIIYDNKSKWEEAFELSGRGSTKIRLQKIQDILLNAVPNKPESLSELKEAFKKIIQDSIEHYMKETEL